MPKQHVALLMGGMSAEREVSLTSGKAIKKALEELGHRVTVVDPQRDVAEVLAKLRPDVAFNALHGTYGEDGCIQGVLEILGIPYTHSGVLASALAMDKPKSIHLFESNGLLCPPGKVVSRETLLKGKHVMPVPYVVKPLDNGSSVGVVLVLDKKQTITEAMLIGDEEFLVEKYIPGREISVAVTDEKPLGVVELQPKAGFYDYTNKYTGGKTDHILPAEISKSAYKQAMEIAHKAHILLGCRGISRADMRYDDEGDGKIYLLEVNTQPGMTPLSLFPEIAAKVGGMTFNDVIAYLLKKATCEIKKPNRAAA